MQPGRMLLVDTELGSIVEDHELKHRMASLRPCGELLKKNVRTLEDIHQAYQASKNLSADKVPLIQPSSQNELIHRDKRLPMFGYSLEDLNILILPMVKNKLVEFQAFLHQLCIERNFSWPQIYEWKIIRQSCKCFIPQLKWRQ